MLDQKTLVLNRSWRAIHVTTVRRALALLYQNAAKVVSPDTFEMHDFESWADFARRRGADCIRTVTLKIPIPEVIVLKGYDGVPVRRVSFSRRNIYKRDNYTCQYCGTRRASEELSIDHVVPRSRGGRMSWTNCVLACLRCNVKKGNRTLAEAGMHLIRTPTRPDWAPYLELTLGYRRQSWEKFISDRYWDTELVE
ncbi:MAG: HNH endonuclease [Planctomycetes bacterium]|nr:HNH endonuclease [Planctomycetota bacterium]